MNSLETCGTKDLIDELISRKTFVGVIIYSNNEHKHEDQIHQDFDLKTSFQKEDAVKLLEVGLDILKSRTERT
jgi:hypothetical protein